MSKDIRYLEQQARLEEFRALRQEMLYRLSSRVWGIGSYVVISGAIFAFASKTAGTLPYLALVILAVPYILYTTSMEDAILSISAYIMVVIEPRCVGLAWEQTLFSLRDKIDEDKAGWKRIFGKWFYILSIVGIYDTIAAFCLYLTFTMDAPLWQQIIGLIAIFSIAGSHLHLCKTLSGASKYRKIYRSLAGQSDTSTNRG